MFVRIPAVLSASVLILAISAAAQSASLPAMPAIGAAAPALTFTRLLQAPAGAKTDWPSLRGKVVVLEFWATWCAPCVAEIPILNRLQAAVDPGKVVILSVDDEQPAVVDKFLAHKYIQGWLGFDTTGKVLERFGVEGRPATIVIDPAGYVASTSVPLPQLKPEQLLALANRKKVVLGGSVDPNVQKQLDADTESLFNAELAVPASVRDALFAINIFPSIVPAPKTGTNENTRIVMRGENRLDITDANAWTILTQGAHLRSTRMTIHGDLPDKRFNLHVDAPHADAQQLSSAIELAVSSATGVHIEHHTGVADALTLTALPSSSAHIKDSPTKGFAFYDEKKKTLQCVSANIKSLAESLETAVGKPVFNESGLTGRITGTWPLEAKDLPKTNDLLAKEFGLVLTPVRRPVETVILTYTQPPPPSPATVKTAAATP